MKILQVIPTFAPAWRWGGPVRVAYEMSKGLAARGHRVTVLTTNMDVDGPMVALAGATLEMDGMTVRYHALSPPRFYWYSRSLRQSLSCEIRRHDIVHVHALFYWPTSFACWKAMRCHVPYVLRPAGSLDATCIEKRYAGTLSSLKSRMKKRCFWTVLGRRETERAAAVHFTSDGELGASKWVPASVRKVVIPLGVEPPPAMLEENGRMRHALDAMRCRPSILFLSRIDAKKGLGILIEALGLLKQRGMDLILVVAGDGDSAELARCRSVAERVGVVDRVLWTGHVQGNDRFLLLRETQVFALPSHRENFGVAVVEALASATPVVISDRVGVAQAVSQDGAGKVTGLEAGQVADALESVLTTPGLKEEMRTRARACYEARFTWKRSLDALEQLYESSLVVPQ